MKTQTTLNSTLAAMFALLIGVSGSTAQVTNWTNTSTGGQSWNLSTNWDNGLPDADTNAVLLGNFVTAFTNVGMNSDTIFRDVSFTALDASERFRLTLGDDSAGRNVTVAAAGTSGAAELSLAANHTTNLTGSITMESEGGSIARLRVSEVGAVWNVTGGIFLGGNASGQTTSMDYGGASTANNSVTINSNLTLNNGSRVIASGNGAENGLLAINGNVTLQSGVYTGGAPLLEVGRFNDTDTGFTIRVDEHLSAAAGIVRVVKGKNLEVGSATISSGGSLVMAGYTGATTTATFRSDNDLVLAGGTLNNTNTVGTSGGYAIEVGRDFVIQTASTLVLSSSAQAITTITLSRNLDIQATSLAAGNLNELRLTLDGTDWQLLEAAVTDDVDTFSFHTLTLNSSLARLSDGFLNVGADEYFKTMNLVNVGTSTLDLNGLQFFVGDSQLVEGEYTIYGGTLIVVPEPSAFLLSGAVCLLALLRRTRSQK